MTTTHNRETLLAHIRTGGWVLNSKADFMVTARGGVSYSHPTQLLDPEEAVDTLLNLDPTNISLEPPVYTELPVAEIEALAGSSLQEILENYPFDDHFNLIEFWRNIRKIEKDALLIGGSPSAFITKKGYVFDGVVNMGYTAAKAAVFFVLMEGSTLDVASPDFISQDSSIANLIKEIL